ncbi:hypothetical protein [Mucilaginibacter limnophilus]|uniref:hypothetical protein n=1 Tax=Mucilaginibacter limnophilus TaxID=1932778 RepID=UPI0013E2FFCA|nr:hypothetical protein [Mucilaginibacter limnophilus]
MQIVNFSLNSRHPSKSPDQLCIQNNQREHYLHRHLETDHKEALIAEVREQVTNRSYRAQN